MLRTSLRKVFGKGFTLVELLIVIIIIAVLAAIAIPKFSNSSNRSKDSALRSNLKLVRNAVDLFRADTGAFPSTLNDLTVTTAPGTGLSSTGSSVTITAADWRGPYLATVPKDWNGTSDFTYTTTGANTGRVATTQTGTATDGTNYSTW
jgi:type II secretion system protein G